MAHHIRVHCWFNPRLHRTVPSKYMITCVRVCACVCTPDITCGALPHLHPKGSYVINIPTRHYKLHVHLPLRIAKGVSPSHNGNDRRYQRYCPHPCCRPHFPAVKPTRAFVVSPTRAFAVSPIRAFVVSPTRAFVVSPTRAFVVSPTRAFVVLSTWAKR